MAMSNLQPRRIQRKRTRGWKMPPNTVYVGRPTKWGNPYLLENFATSTLCLLQFGRWVRRSGLDLEELRGKNLACWCPLVDKDGKPFPCHADVLLELANA